MPRFKYILSNSIEGTLEITEPKGWDDVEFALEREDTHGLLFEASTPVKFYGQDNMGINGGKNFIKKVEDTQGIDADILIEIQILNNGIYESFFKGRLNLESLNESTDDGDLEVNLEDISFYATFQKRYNQKVDFSTDINPDGKIMQSFTPVDFNLHGKVIEQRQELRTTSLLQSTSSDIQAGGSGGQDRLFYLDIGFTDEIVDEIETAFTYQLEYSSLSTIESKKYRFEAPENGNYTIDFDFDLQYDIVLAWVGTLQNETNWAVVTAKLVILNEDATVNTEDILYTNNFDTADAINDYNNIDFFFEKGNNFIANITKNQTYFLNKGMEVYLFIEFGLDYKFDDHIIFVINTQMLAGGHFNVKALTTKEATTAKALFNHDVGKNIVQKITGVNNAFYSEILGNPDVQYTVYNQYGEYSNHILLTGKQIRKLDDHIQMSFKDWFQSNSDIFNLGFDIENVDGQNRIRVEGINHFYQEDAIVLNTPLENISGFRRSVIPEKYINEIEVGYQKWQPEKINGLDEICTISEYSTRLQTVGQKYTIKSKILASGSVIETLRRLIEQVTTDSEYDKEVFIVSVLQGIKQSEKAENFSNISGVLDPETGYNYRLTPARMLLRHGNVINSGLIKYRNSKYNRVYHEGNPDLVDRQLDSMAGNFDNEILIHDQNIVWNYADLKEVDPLWTNYKLEFEYPLSYKDYKVIKENKYRKVVFTIGGQIYNGWIQKFTYKPNESIAVFELIQSNEIPFDYQLPQSVNLLTESLDDFLTQNNNTIIIE